MPLLAHNTEVASPSYSTKTQAKKQVNVEVKESECKKLECLGRVLHWNDQGCASLRFGRMGLACLIFEHMRVIFTQAEETQLLLQMETGEGRPRSSRWREVYMAIAVTLALVAAACCLPIPSVHQQVLRPTANVFQALWHSRTYDDERLHGQSEQAERENGVFAQDSTFSHPPAATKTHGDAAFAARQSAYRAGWLEDGEGDASTSSQPDFRRGDWLDANWDYKTPPGTVIEHVDTSRSGRADFRGDWLDVNWDDKTADTVIEHVDTSTSSRPVFEGDWLDTNLNNETPGTVVEHDWVEVGDSSTDSDGDGEGIPDEAPDTGSLDGMDGDSDGFGDGPAFDAALPSNWHNDVHDSSTLPATTTIPPGPFPAAETYHNNYDSDNPLGVKALPYSNTF